MFLCDRFVRLEGRGRGVRVSRVYATARGAAGARSRGFRVEQCGSTEFEVDSVYEVVYGYGESIGRLTSEFDGAEVICSRCRSHLARYDVSDLVELAGEAFGVEGA